MSDSSAQTPSDTPETVLSTIRSDPTQRRVALVIAIVLGLLATSIHWFGLVLGGALVGLVSARLRWAVLSALGFGILVLAVFVLVSPGLTVTKLLSLQPPVFVTVVAALVLPLFGSLVRGL